MKPLQYEYHVDYKGSASISFWHEDGSMYTDGKRFSIQGLKGLIEHSNKMIKMLEEFEVKLTK